MMSPMPRRQRPRREPRAKGGANVVVPSRRGELLIPLVAVILIAIAYHGALDAGFVYDDQTQILQNTYIQDGRYFWKSMTVDVWAFRGDKGEAWSNYWRPLFIAWLHLNHRLFGFDPGGWHLMNVLAHGLATLLVFRLLVRLKVAATVQAMVTWCFAVHPVHVQSVTWISGIPDVLMAIFLLGSLLLYLRGRETGSAWAWTGAIVLHACGLLSKEAAVAFPLVVAGLEWLLDRSSWRTILRRSLPFLATAVVYVALRASILGKLRELAPGAPSLGGVLLTLPEALAFYVRQSLLPIALGPIYGLRPVTAEQLGLANFFGPLLFLAVVASICWWLARSQRMVLAGVGWFLAFLVLALDIRIFLPELMVQDRYLYLPLFGLLLVAALGIDALLRHSPRHGTPAGYAVAIVLAVVMTAMTISYNKAWLSEVTLWEQGVRVDPTSAIAYTHLGEAYRSEQRLPEARAAMEKALALNPDMTVANIAMGALEIRERRYAEAETYLRRVLTVYPDYAAALEQLGLAYMQQKKFDEAIALMRDGARRMPYNVARYGVNVAVLYRLSGRSAESRRELESLRGSFGASSDPRVVIGWFYLGELDREEGRMADAKQEYVRYMRATDAIRDNAEVERLRSQVRQYGVE
jgi:tetratricopeptide (TPR) repeat protein